ncbi:hypothetical protein [Streptomyces sp. DH24]|uniref:hypothetical protein n=1 Tax=Streptomyces sp. DH24 TaxID=3040123 RepID=UPI0024430691|nr:hypothetical protein [Streptomyces sp. DH24]MDG9717860.1 hypothetical protein [Streptomyces sp. DH24]
MADVAFVVTTIAVFALAACLAGGEAVTARHPVGNGPRAAGFRRRKETVIGSGAPSGPVIAFNGPSEDLGDEAGWGA